MIHTGRVLTAAQSLKLEISDATFIPVGPQPIALPYGVMSDGLMLSDITAGDHAEVLALNQAAQPHVNGLSPEELARLVEWSCYCRVVRDGARIAGFLLALPPGLPYQSLNYRWFSDRYDDFIYIDRVAVAPTHQRRGVGQRLYEDLHRYAADRAPRVACEVNLAPRNDPSLAFHDRLGYRQVGTQPTEGGAKTVSLMVRDLECGVALGSVEAYS